MGITIPHDAAQSRQKSTISSAEHLKSIILSDQPYKTKISVHLYWFE